jgi:hypothetical protein
MDIQYIHGCLGAISMNIDWMWWWLMRVIVAQESELDILMHSLYVL